MGDESTDSEPFDDIEDAFEEMAEVDEEMVDEPVEVAADVTGSDGEVEDGEEAGGEVGDREESDGEASEEAPEGTHVVTGGEFEREFSLGRERTAEFLRDLARQIEADTTLTVAGDGWKLPFEYAEPIEIEVEHEGAEDGDPRELEIEIEFAWGGASDHLEVT